jgi:hypothetical protein
MTAGSVRPVRRAGPSTISSARLEGALSGDHRCEKGHRRSDGKPREEGVARSPSTKPRMDTWPTVRSATLAKVAGT